MCGPLLWCPCTTLDLIKARLAWEVPQDPLTYQERTKRWRLRTWDTDSSQQHITGTTCAFCLHSDTWCMPTWLQSQLQGCHAFLRAAEETGKVAWRQPAIFLLIQTEKCVHCRPSAFSQIEWIKWIKHATWYIGRRQQRSFTSITTQCDTVTIRHRPWNHRY